MSVFEAYVITFAVSNLSDSFFFGLGHNFDSSDMNFSYKNPMSL